MNIPMHTSDERMDSFLLDVHLGTKWPSQKVGVRLALLLLLVF